MLRSREIELRSLQDSDLDFLKKIENNKENWQFGSENKEYSHQHLLDYIANAKIDITNAKQYRFVIQFHKNPIGFIDLFDYTNYSAGLGVIISKKYRNKGFAKVALKLITDYAFTTLGLSKLYCTIQKDNIASVKLFNSCNFELLRQEQDLQYFVKLAKNYQ